MFPSELAISKVWKYSVRFCTRMMVPYHLLDFRVIIYLIILLKITRFSCKHALIQAVMAWDETSQKPRADAFC